MLDFFASGYGLAKRLYYLAFLPFIVDLISLTGRFLQSRYAYSFRIGVKFSLPFYFPSLTNVYDFPVQSGITIQLPEFGLVPVFGFGSVIVYMLVLAFVSAGYLGTLNSAIAGVSPSFVTSATKYFLRILLYGLIWLGLGLIGITLALGSPTLAVLYFLFLIVLNYFLFLTPFVMVADDTGLVEGLLRSINISGSVSSRTIEYVMLYAFATVGVSAIVYFVLNTGLIGFFATIAGFAFVGTVLVASTFYFLSNLSVQQPRVEPPPGPT